jgi:hypothetical protein
MEENIESECNGGKYSLVSVMEENIESECNGGKCSFVLKNVVFEIKSIVHPGNNENSGKVILFVSGAKYQRNESA